MAYTNKNNNKKRSQNSHNNHNSHNRSMTNVSKISQMPVSTRMSSNTAMYSNSGVLAYPGRSRQRTVRKGNNTTKNQKFYNTRKEIVSGDELVTPLRPRMKIKAKDHTEGLNVRTIWLEKAKLPVTVFAYVMIITAIFLGLVYSYTRLNVVVDEISKTNEKIERAYDDELYLLRQLEARDYKLEIERIAVEVLGMVKEDVLPKRYVSLKNKDKVERIGGGEDILTKISTITTSFTHFFAAPPEEE